MSPEESVRAKEYSDEAFEVYASAAKKGDPRMKNVYTDVASMVTRNTPPRTLELVAKRLRTYGFTIGNGFLKDFVVTIDYRGGVITLERHGV